MEVHIKNEIALELVEISKLHESLMKEKTTACPLYMHYLSKSPVITTSFIDEHPEIEWAGISENPNITMEYVIAHPEFEWNWKELAGNPGITLGDIETHRDKFNWNDEITINYLSLNPNLTPEYIIAHPELPWTRRIYMGPNISIENIDDLSQVLVFNAYWFSANPNLTIDIVLAHREWNWGWFNVSSNKNISMEDVRANPELPWDYNGLSCNPNLTIEFIRERMDERWNWWLISSNSAMTEEIMQENSDLGWRPGNFINNKSLSIDFIISRIGGIDFIRGFDWCRFLINSFDGEVKRRILRSRRMKAIGWRMAARAQMGLGN